MQRHPQSGDRAATGRDADSNTFSLKNLPLIFQRVMDTVLASLKDHFCLVYVDDIIVYSDMFKEHVMHISWVLKKIVNAEQQAFDQLKMAIKEAAILEFSEKDVPMLPVRKKSNLSGKWACWSYALADFTFNMVHKDVATQTGNSGSHNGGGVEIISYSNETQKEEKEEVPLTTFRNINKQTQILPRFIDTL
ncbi:hypothetical protein PhCBS80983_g06426 [Powellomyces hirtus]|uniref:Reverse transcriptase domain-containing protein n=1 Tax=Powellomyces hirtus TaxID=109895 RepID=A0A507DMF7_9FUNG|nr:hypothetical protein PhCBS80983_g06426 [Powellomyces hirtus]